MTKATWAGGAWPAEDERDKTAEVEVWVVVAASNVVWCGIQPPPVATSSKRQQ